MALPLAPQLLLQGGVECLADLTVPPLTPGSRLRLKIATEEVPLRVGAGTPVAAKLAVAAAAASGSAMAPAPPQLASSLLRTVVEGIVDVSPLQGLARAGDVLLAVNGANLLGLRQEAVVAAFDAATRSGQPLTLSVLRPSAPPLVPPLVPPLALAQPQSRATVRAR